MTPCVYIHKTGGGKVASGFQGLHTVIRAGCPPWTNWGVDLSPERCECGVRRSVLASAVTSQNKSIRCKNLEWVMGCFQQSHRGLVYVIEECDIERYGGKMSGSRPEKQVA